MEQCIVWFYAKVCCVQAQVALRQFHVTERRTRQDFFYLNLLEPDAQTPEEEPPGKMEATSAPPRTNPSSVRLTGLCLL